MDELSLIKDEAVRVKIQAREIDKIRGFVEIFIGGVGYEVRFVPEKLTNKNITPNPPPPPSGHDYWDSEDDEGEDLIGSDDERTRREINKGNQNKSSDLKQTGSSSMGRHASSGGDQSKNQVEIKKPQEKTPIPIEGPDPITGQYLNIEECLEKKDMSITVKPTIRDRGEPSTDMSQQPEAASKAQEYITVHCEGGGTRQLRKNVWPDLKLKQDTIAIAEPVVIPEADTIDGPGSGGSQQGKGDSRLGGRGHRKDAWYN